LDSPLRTRLVLKVAVELAIGGDQGAGAAHDKRDLVISIALVHEDHNACKCRDIVFNRAEGVIQPPGNLIGLVPQKEETHRLDAVCLAGADILLLSAAGDFELTTAQGLDVTDDGTHAAVEQTEREVLVAEQSSLVASLSREAEDAGTAQALDSVSQTHLKIVLAGVEGEADGNFLALLQGLASGFLGGHDEKLDLP
jgi:hypothetical protein